MAGKLHPPRSCPTGHPGEVSGRRWPLPHRGRPDVAELVLSVERWHGLGSLKDVSLKDARIKRSSLRIGVEHALDIFATAPASCPCDIFEGAVNTSFLPPQR
jgi:hypothetical protein